MPGRRGIHFRYRTTAASRGRSPLPEDLTVAACFAMFGIGATELLVLGGIVLLLFGTRLPKVMRSLGEGIVEFKRGVQGIEDTGASPREPNGSDAR